MLYDKARILVAAACLTLGAHAVVSAPAAAQGKPASKPGKTRKAPPEARRPVKAPRGKGVRAMFEYGQALYDAGKYGAALGAFEALLRKFPGHEPAMIQTAKSLYRLDRIKDAHVVFARINPQHLDPETSYEYGWSFYTAKQWEGALYAFQRVPKGHALFDLANYYGALCAIKLKKYEDAEDMLEKAVVLPDKLAKSRTLYIKHVQALKLMQQKTALAKERDQEKDSLKTAAKTDAAAKKEKEKEAAGTKPADGSYVHTGVKGIDKYAEVKHKAEHQYIDNHGLSETTYDAQVSTFELKSGPLLPIPGLRIKDRNAAFGMQLTLGAEDRISEGTQQRILIDETQDDLSRLSVTDLGKTETKAGNVAAEPWFEFPLPENVWLAVGGEIAFLYPEFERGGRSGTRKGYMELAGSTPYLDFTSQVAYTETLNAETDPTTNIVGGFGKISREVLTKLVGSLKVTHELYDYLIDEAAIDGPDTITRGEVELKQTLPLGFLVKVKGAYEQQTNYIFHGIEPFGQLSADGAVATGKVTLSADPVSWFSASLSQLITRTTWTLDHENPAAHDSFELNVADYVEQFEGVVGLNFDF